jgi:hypothetical protein
MQNVQMPKVDMPDVADMFANFFGGSGGAKKKRAIQGTSNASPQAAGISSRKTK